MRRLFLIAIAALVSLVAACGDGDDRGGAAGDGSGGGGNGAGGASVTIENFLFRPDDLAVDAGTTVTWTNKDNATHTVTAGTPDEPAGTFDHSLDEGDTAEVALDEAGTFAYFCSIHPNMTGKVEVG